jgi:hypothetical protein
MIKALVSTEMTRISPRGCTVGANDGPSNAVTVFYVARAPAGLGSAHSSCFGQFRVSRPATIPATTFGRPIGRADCAAG